jgi:predicted transposase/invertase (TIGR01784 family)
MGIVMKNHDNIYKNIFSFKEAVRDLLQGFISETWINQLDFDSLKKESTGRVTDDLRTRENDLIWSIALKPTPGAPPQNDDEKERVYIYLLLEFQSTIDPYMAVRVMSYVALLYQDLIKAKAIKNGKLPCVFPLVLYNGERPWKAATSINDLIEPSIPGLDLFRAQSHYFLIDEAQVDQALLPLTNCIANFVTINHPQSDENLAKAFKALANNPDLAQNMAYKRAFGSWFNDFVFTNMNIQDEAQAKILKNLPLEMLTERINMITGHMDVLKQDWLQQGVSQGKVEGEAKLLKTLLTERFGSLPIDFENLIDAAPLHQIEAWFKTAIKAPSLSSIFGH